MIWSFDRLYHRSVCYGGGGGGGGAPQRIITNDMRAAAEVAVNQWNDYQQRFVPFENRFIESAKNTDETKALQTMAAADVAQQAGKAATTMDVMHGTTGVNTGRAVAAGLTDARAGALDRRAAGLGTVMAMGRGQETEALSGLTDQAVLSSDLATKKAINDSKIDTANRGMYMSAFSTPMGLGAAYLAQPSTPQKVPAAGFTLGSPSVGPTIEAANGTAGNNYFSNLINPMKKYGG